MEWFGYKRRDGQSISFACAEQLSSKARKVTELRGKTQCNALKAHQHPLLTAPSSPMPQAHHTQTSP